MVERVYDAIRFNFVTFLKNGACNSSTNSYHVMYDAIDEVSVKTIMYDCIKL